MFVCVLVIGLLNHTNLLETTPCSSSSGLLLKLEKCVDGAGYKRKTTAKSCGRRAEKRVWMATPGKEKKNGVETGRQRDGKKRRGPATREKHSKKLWETGRKRVWTGTREQRNNRNKH